MKLKYLAITAILACSSLTFAQGSGSTAPDHDESSGANIASADDFKVTRVIEGKITEIKAKDNVVVIEGRNGRRKSLHLSEDTKVASVKSAASGPSLKLADLKTGQKVKAVFRPSDSRAVEVKLLE